MDANGRVSNENNKLLGLHKLQYKVFKPWDQDIILNSNYI